MRIEARDLAFTVPVSTVAGLTRVRLINHGTPEQTDTGVEIHARMGMVEVFEVR